MPGRDTAVVDADLYGPGDGSMATFGWKQAPPGLATRRQLRETGLCPGGQEPIARIECRRGQRWAWLYRIDLAKPKRTPTLAQEAALDKAMSARQTCRSCRRRYLHCLPLRTLGSCLECAEGIPADPATYTLPASPAHHLAA
ncbi:RRQRL motif-containing zinc-binding protein [Streptomyces sp. NPDC055210]